MRYDTIRYNILLVLLLLLLSICILTRVNAHSTVLPRRKQASEAPKPPAYDQQSSINQQLLPRAAARPGQVARLAMTSAGRRALQGWSDVQGPKRASRIARLFPVPSPSRPVSSCRAALSFPEAVVSSHVVCCAALACAVLFAQDESMKRDECSWMETDGVAWRRHSSPQPTLPLLFFPPLRSPYK